MRVCEWVRMRVCGWVRIMRVRVCRWVGARVRVGGSEGEGVWVAPWEE